MRKKIFLFVQLPADSRGTLAVELSTRATLDKLEYIHHQAGPMPAKPEIYDVLSYNSLLLRDGSATVTVLP